MLYIDILLIFESLCLLEERVGIILVFLIIGTNDGRLTVVIFTLSLYCSVNLVEKIFRPSRCQHNLLYIFIVYSLLFSINLSAFTEIFVFIAKIFIKIVIT